MNFRRFTAAALWLAAAAVSLRADSIRLTAAAGIITASTVPDGIGQTFAVKGKLVFHARGVFGY